MRVRRLEPGDEGEVLRSVHLLDDPPNAGAVRAYLSDERNVFFLAYQDETPVGFLRGTGLGQLKTEQKQMFLYEIGVDERFRRRGVARALIEALLELCRSLRFDEVFVFTDPSNEPAVRLYRTTGAVTETLADRMYVYQLRGSVGPSHSG
jgi:ribosomal protein S18 acetylase RimI-like enzyme